MRGIPGIAGRTFNALGRDGVNAIATAQGSSESLNAGLASSTRPSGSSKALLSLEPCSTFTTVIRFAILRVEGRPG